jgi:hypothetical protein
MINYKNQSFFEQHMDISLYPELTNPEFILKKFINRNILHIGCVDSMYYNKTANLHIKLSTITNNLVGFDIDKKGLEQLNLDCPSTYFSEFKDVLTKSYDTVLVPEVIEHVLNVQEFIENLLQIETKEYFITAPYFGLSKSNIKIENGKCVEIVHPDHKCWHSPYTLYNVCKPLIQKLNAEKTSEVMILRSTSVGIHIKKD